MLCIRLLSNTQFSYLNFRDLKTLNLQSIRDAIDSVYKQLGKYLTAEDLKRLETQVHGLSTKTDKNTTDIRHIFDLVKEI